MHVETDRLEGVIAQHAYEVVNAELRSKNEEKSECIQRLNSDVVAKTEQLKGIEQMTAEVPENLSKMSFDDIKKLIKAIHRKSMPGYLPTSVEETAEQQVPAATPKKPISTSFRVKTATKREHRPLGQESSQQKSIALRNKATSTGTTTKPQSMAKKK